MRSKQEVQDFIEHWLITLNLNQDELFDTIYPEEWNEWDESEDHENLEYVRRAAEVLGVFPEDILTCNDHAIMEWARLYPQVTMKRAMMVGGHPYHNEAVEVEAHAMYQHAQNLFWKAVYTEKAALLYEEANEYNRLVSLLDLRDALTGVPMYLSTLRMYRIFVKDEPLPEEMSKEQKALQSRPMDPNKPGFRSYVCVGDKGLKMFGENGPFEVAYYPWGLAHTLPSGRVENSAAARVRLKKRTRMSLLSIE